jgi:hypothetical protein
MKFYNLKFYNTDDSVTAVIPAVIDDIDAQLDAAEQKLSAEPAAPQVDKVEPITPEVVKPAESTPEVKTEQTPKVETPEVTPVTGQSEPDKGLTLTEEAFNKLSPEQQTKYAKFKGKSINDILDSYGNLETYLGKKTKEALTQKPEQVSVPQTVEQIKQTKDNLVVTQLRSKFPSANVPDNIDENSPEFIEWLRDFYLENPMQGKRFIDAREQIANEIDKDFDYIQDIRENYQTYNDQAIESTLENFENYVTNELKVNLKDLGIDLRAKDADGFYNVMNELLNDPTAVDNKGLDPKIVQFGKSGTPFAGIPVYNLEAAINKITRIYGAKVYNESLARARKDAVVRSNDKPDVIPSLSVATDKGVRGNKQSLEAIINSTDNPIERNKLIEEALDSAQ